MKWLVGEIMSLNEDWVMANPDAFGVEIILKQGFTDNQKKWITNLNEKLKKLKEIQQLADTDIEVQLINLREPASLLDAVAGRPSGTRICNN